MDTEKNKNELNNNEKQEARKNFIVEKVVGREISGKNALKQLLLAASSGLLFGLAAAVTIVMVGKSVAYFDKNDDKEVVGAETVEKDEGPEQKPSEADPQGNSQGNSQGNTQGNSQGNSQGNPQGSTQGNHQGNTQIQTQPDSTSPEETGNQVPVHIDGEEYFIDKEVLQGIIAEQLECDDLSSCDLNLITDEYKAAIGNVDRYVVAVNAKSTNQSWFDDIVETSDTFSGIIISTTDTEILILTTEEAVISGNALNVTFHDGTNQEAVVKQSSHHDKIAVIAVSKEGLGKDFIKNIQPIQLGSSDKIEAGDAILAIGAPIGKVRSYEFGQVSYVGHNEITADGRKDVFYSQISANPEKGTFITNIKGEFIGIAKAADEDVRYYGESSAVRIISVGYLKSILLHLKNGTEVPYLGIKGKSISFDMKYKNFPQGMYVMECVDGSPAYLAGIKKGDIITGVNDSLISDSDSYEYAVKKLKAGETVKVKLKRSSANVDYKDLEFVFTVGAR